MSVVEFSQTLMPDTEFQLGALRSPKNSSLTVTGARCCVVIGDGAWFRDARIRIESDDSKLTIDPGVAFTGAIFLKGKGPNHVHIGAGTSVGGANIICSEGSNVAIGKDCMFSWGIEIRSTDSHGIFDMTSGARLNPAEDIRLGDHVWIAAKATILKGTHVAAGSVIGIGSLVTGKFDEENSLIVGNPARLIRSGVRWERQLLG